MMSVSLSAVQNLGWSHSNLTGLQGRVMIKTNHKVEGAYLHRLTDEAAQNVLEKIGYAQEEIATQLQTLDVYVFSLISFGGVPYIVADRTAKKTELTAGFWKEQLIGHGNRKEFNLYFEMEKGAKIKGFAGKLERYYSVPEEGNKEFHPLRKKHSSQLIPLEVSFDKRKEDMSSLNRKSRDRRLSEEEREEAKRQLNALKNSVDPTIELEKTYEEIVKPYLLQEIQL